MLTAHASMHAPEIISEESHRSMSNFPEGKELLVPESMHEDTVEATLQGSSEDGRSEDQVTVHAEGTKGWLYATIILCLYGFFKEFKPSEPFLTPYLVDYKNFTKNEVRTRYVYYS